VPTHEGSPVRSIACWIANSCNPTTLFETDLGKAKPSGFSYPSVLQKALSAGDVATFEHLYLDRVKSSPFAPAIAKTTTGRTVLGLKY
jgi:hypothetical protein